jgi:predicted RNA-binding protein associated with RNAse of E/G family
VATPRDRRIVEVKRTLHGKVIRYPAEPLVVEEGQRAVLLYRIDVAEAIAGGRITLAAGTLSFGYFWFDRPYNVYHFNYAGETLVYYVNIGRFRSLSETELVWDDYAVDILLSPDGAVEILDEDEVPETIDDSIQAFITEGKLRVLAELDTIIDSVESETRFLESAFKPDPH